MFLCLTCCPNKCLLVRYEEKTLILSSPKTQSNNLTETIYAVGAFTGPEKSEVVLSDFERVLRGTGRRP